MSDKKINSFAEKEKEMSSFNPDYLNSPCTITEAAQIARGAAEDVFAIYLSRFQDFQIAVSLHLEILKRVIIESGLITEEEYLELFNNLYKEYRKEMEKIISSNKEENSPKMSVNVDEISVERS